MNITGNITSDENELCVHLTVNGFGVSKYYSFKSLIELYERFDNFEKHMLVALLSDFYNEIPIADVNDLVLTTTLKLELENWLSNTLIHTIEKLILDKTTLFKAGDECVITEVSHSCRKTNIGKHVVLIERIYMFKGDFLAYNFCNWEFKETGYYWKVAGVSLIQGSPYSVSEASKIIVHEKHLSKADFKSCHKYFLKDRDDRLIRQLKNIEVFDDEFVYFDLNRLSNKDGFWDGDVISLLFDLPKNTNGKLLHSHDVLYEVISAIMKYNIVKKDNIHNSIRMADSSKFERLKFPIAKIEEIIDNLKGE